MIQNAKLEKSMKEANNKKVLSLSIAIGFMMLIFIICACILAFKPALENDKVPTKDSINTSYFDGPQEWTPSTGVCNQPPSNLLGAANESRPIPSGCTLYTFDNDFGVYSRPNTKSVISDYLGGLVQAEELPDTDFCVDRDQIVAQKVVHECTGPNCLSVVGNNIKKGVKETFSAACVENNNICKDLLTAISFNFRLYYPTDSAKFTNNMNTINDTTLFLSVKSITVPEKIFNKIPQFYINSGLFTQASDSSITVYPAIITFEKCNPLDYRQKFRIQRYTYTSEAGSQPGFAQTSGKDNTGFFCNIIYRIGNLRLSYDESKNTFCFIDNDDREPTWLLMPEIDLSTNIVSTIQRYQMSNYFTDQSPVYQAGVSFVQVASQKSPYFVNLVSSSNGLEVIDTSNNPQSQNLRYINLADMDDSDPAVNNKEVVFSVYYTLDVGSRTIEEVYDENASDSDSDSDNDFNPVTGMGNINYKTKTSIPQDQWENLINVTSHVSEPTFNEGPGRIYHRYQMVKPGNVANASTFYSTLESEIVYYLKLEGPETGIGRNRDSYVSVYTGMSAVGTYSNGVPDYAPGIKYLGTVKDQHYVQDGSAIWRRVPLYEGIKHFSPSYFIDNNLKGDPLKSVTQPSSGTTLPIKYVVPKTGLLNLIDFSNSTIENPIPVQEIPNLLPLGISSGAVTNNNSNAQGEFSINFGVDQTQKIKVQSFTVINSGENNTTKPVDIPIPGSSMVVKNAKFITANQDIIYQAVPSVSGSGGATFKASIFANGTSLESVSVISRGYGYQQDEIVYIVQTDSAGIVTPEMGFSSDIETLEDFLEYPNEVKKLVGVKVSTEPFVGAKHNLLGAGENPTDLSNYFNYYPYFSKAYGNVPGYFNNQLFGKSPPQIAFLGHEKDSMSETMILAKEILVNSTNPDDFVKFFSANSAVDEPITNTNYIKTIQFTDLNYSSKESANFFISQNSNQLSSSEKPVLGRFIPYRHFGTLSSPEGDDFNDKFMYNNNYTQFIPYGLKHIYETYIDLKNLPSF